MALSINEEGEEFYEAEGGAVSDKSPAAYRLVLMVFRSITKNWWKSLLRRIHADKDGILLFALYAKHV